VEEAKRDAVYVGAGTLAAGSYVIGIVVGVGQVNIAAGTLLSMGVLCFLIGVMSLAKVISDED